MPERRLTKEIAEQFLADRGSVKLTEFTEFDDDAAECLSKYEGTLNLDGLTSLSDAAAESLSKYEGTLSLGGLTSLSDAAADSLSKHKGTLSLSGLTSLSDAAAESLSKHEGWWLSLEGLTELADGPGHVALAESLGRLDANVFGLRLSLTSLSDAAAEGLSKYKGPLFLDGLTSLPDAAAESLSKHQGSFLSLEGLTKLSDAAAMSLNKYEGQLSLGHVQLSFGSSLAEPDDQFGYGYVRLMLKLGRSLNDLTTLSDAAAGQLGEYEGSLALNGLRTLSNAAAESLSKCGGNLSLNGLTTLSDAAAVHLSKHSGHLSRSWLGRNPVTCDESLGEHQQHLRLVAEKKGALNLRGLSSLSDAAAESLLQHKGPINVSHRIYKKLLTIGVNKYGPAFNDDVFSSINWRRKGDERLPPNHNRQPQEDDEMLGWDWGGTFESGSDDPPVIDENREDLGFSIDSD